MNKNLDSLVNTENGERVKRGLKELSKEEKIKMKQQLRLETIAHEMYHQVDESVNGDLVKEKSNQTTALAQQKMSVSRRFAFTKDTFLINAGKMTQEDFMTKYKSEYDKAEEEVSGYYGDEDKKGYLNQSGCNLISAPPTEFNKNRLYVERRARLFEMIVRKETGIEGILGIGVKKK